MYFDGEDDVRYVQKFSANANPTPLTQLWLYSNYYYGVTHTKKPHFQWNS